MGNNWKYASLGQRERLDLIRNGNTEVYNAEKIKNSSLRGLRAALGLSTAEIDEWDSIIDNAKESTQKQKQNNLPKFMSTKNDRVANAYNSYLRELRAEIEKQTTEALETALKDSNYIAEFLANNGYSKDGTMRTEAQKKVDEELLSTLSDIRKYYNSKAESTKSKMF